MYFKKLELTGFKSFSQKTTLHFEPGITAIVGPNGCGKSNIFDAIRWCLGEQSIKSLRGGKMEDVIFNGTENIAPQNAAEVSLTLSNEAKILPIEYDEVTITRRLFRSGESDYLINNNSVRLKDINELLMGTGIGAESYSLVEQGKIDLVISSKPEDRRLVFDEATGVSKYKAKKREAMRRLEDTDNNLLRINDIIAEVKRQIGSIERQANKARRYKEIFERLKDLELQYSSIELKTFAQERMMLDEIAKKAQQEESQLNTELQKLDEKLMHHQKELGDLDANITNFKEAISNLQNACERSRQHISLNSDRIIDLNKHIEILTKQKEQTKEKISSHQKSISELNEQLLSIHEEYSKKEMAVKEKEQLLVTLSKNIETAQKQNNALKSRTFEISLSESKINNEINENASSLHTLKARERRLQTEKIKTEEENGELSKQLDEIDSDVTDRKNKIRDSLKGLEQLELQESQLTNFLKERADALRTLENEKISLHSQIEFLKELKLKYDGMPQAKNGVLEITDLPAEKVTGVIAHAREVNFNEGTKTYRIICEVKFISFDLVNLQAKIEQIEKEIAGINQEISEKENERLELQNRIKDSEGALEKERYELTNKEALLSNLRDNAKRLNDELALISLELSEVNEGLNEGQSKEEKLKGDLSQLKSEVAGIEFQTAENLNIITHKTGDRENILVELTQLKSELENQASLEDSLKKNLNFFNTNLQQDTNALNVHDQEIEHSLQKVGDLNEEIKTLELKIKTDEESIQTNTHEHSRLSQIRIEEVNAVDFTQKQIIDLEEKIDKLKENNHRYQMQEQELNFKYTNIKNRILQSYNVDLDESPYPEEQIKDINKQELFEEIARLKEKVEAFGTVNLVALEELEELKNRYDFLTQQQNDLNMGKDSLQKAIIKINRTTRKMFLETFQIVAEHFKNYYKLLFGGGEARLFLIDEEDVLESGIEIICRPPGKKLQNITLLSGGEKALSAIALIFAIFKTKPSPFCVLDEIDAALDESNIGRFSRMLDDFSQTSQFIVITHNKKTIARANVMYGITMEQSGMSKIVSVKLHEEKDLNKTNTTPSPEKKELSSEPA